METQYFQFDQIQYCRQHYDTGIILSGKGDTAYVSAKAKDGLKISENSPHKNYKSRVTYLSRYAIEEDDIFTIRQPINKHAVELKTFKVIEMSLNYCQCEILKIEQKTKQRRKKKELKRKLLETGNALTPGFEDTDFSPENFNELMDFFAAPDTEDFHETRFIPVIDRTQREFIIHDHDYVILA